MPATDLSLLIDAARQAGDIALRFSGKTARRWDKPGGAGPVTEADLAVNDHFAKTLLTARPDYGWLSEETEDATDRTQSGTVFIVDPIDGTRNFTEGGRTWAHSVAVARNGQITAAVVYLPMRDKMYAAALGQGATLNDAPLQVGEPDNLSEATILAAKPNLDPRLWLQDVPAFNRAYRPSLAYRLALVGEGRFDGMLTFRPSWEWDIAAGSLIAAEAGAQITDRTGAPLRFNASDPRLPGVICAVPRLHDVLARAHNPDIPWTT